MKEVEEENKIQKICDILRDETINPAKNQAKTPPFPISYRNLVVSAVIPQHSFFTGGSYDLPHIFVRVGRCTEHVTPALFLVNYIRRTTYSLSEFRLISRPIKPIVLPEGDPALGSVPAVASVPFEDNFGVDNQTGRD